MTASTNVAKINSQRRSTFACGSATPKRLTISLSPRRARPRATTYPITKISARSGHRHAARQRHRLATDVDSVLDCKQFEVPERAHKVRRRNPELLHSFGGRALAGGVAVLALPAQLRGREALSQRLDLIDGIGGLPRGIQRRQFVATTGGVRVECLDTALLGLHGRIREIFQVLSVGLQRIDPRQAKPPASFPDWRASASGLVSAV
jgi:hypothetical protein